MIHHVSPPMIRVRGAAVHNLQDVDLDLPHGRLIAFCGVSGSGKSSLALDTLYAEGQRRYIESFSTYTRQFLEQLDKPAVDSIEGIPPSVAVTRKNVSRSSRATVGSATQINEHLQLLFARIGKVVCHSCGAEVQRDTVDSVADSLAELPGGQRLMVGFRARLAAGQARQDFVDGLLALGYRRVIHRQQMVQLSSQIVEELDDHGVDIVIDRLKGGGDLARLTDSLENAMDEGHGMALIWTECPPPTHPPSQNLPSDSSPAAASANGSDAGSSHDTSPPNGCVIDGRPWHRQVFSRQLRCDTCDLQYPDPEPQLFNYNSPHGACPACEGFGNLVEVDLKLVVPDPSKTLREGAIAPWNTPAYAHELEELISLAADYDLPLDTPWAELSEAQKGLVQAGVEERDFGGLDGFFAWLERRKYKVHIRVFLSRWRSYSPCPTCAGDRLNRAALSVQVGALNIAEVGAQKIRDARTWLNSLQLSTWQAEVGRILLDQVSSRLAYLDEVGVGHLSIDRPLRTLGGGESQRVALTSALSSNLTGMLYVLDEPSAGLHPADMPRLVRAVRQLCQRGNTVAVVEHELSLIREADEVVELGPGAGELGGKIVFQGPLAEMLQCPQSRTGDWVSGRRLAKQRAERRETNQGWIRLVGARGNNLRNLTVEFPLGVLCVVTGVSGAGKSTLVQQTLYLAAAQKLRLEVESPAPLDDLLGLGQIEEIILVDQSPIGRTPRSNPVTYVKAFDPIRTLFAETMEAKARGFKAGHFSFNVEGGRCEACQGDGSTQIDMRFLADVYMTCSECQGARYRREVLDIKYRGLSIDEVLQLSVREAFTFFRGHKKIQARLKCLIDVGLEYLRLGQPANTLSSGEAQRLKLSNYVAAMRRGRTLFVLDEPTSGLHHSDVMQLLDCFDSLVAMGHSLVVVDHHPLMMTAADHLIDLGPGAADDGGQIVAEGTPEEVAQVAESATGQFLAKELNRIATMLQE